MDSYDLYSYLMKGRGTTLRLSREAYATNRRQAWETAVGLEPGPLLDLLDKEAAATREAASKIPGKKARRVTGLV